MDKEIDQFCNEIKKMAEKVGITDFAFCGFSIAGDNFLDWTCGDGNEESRGNAYRAFALSGQLDNLKGDIQRHIDSGTYDPIEGDPE